MVWIQTRWHRTYIPITFTLFAGLLTCHLAHGRRFVNMGFPKADVIAAMRKLNYRGANAANVGEDAVLNALLGG